MRVRPRDAAGNCSVPLQLLVIPLVGMAAGQNHSPGESTGFDPGNKQLSEPFGFVLWVKQGIKTWMKQGLYEIQMKSFGKTRV